MLEKEVGSDDSDSENSRNNSTDDDVDAGTITEPDDDKFSGEEDTEIALRKRSTVGGNPTGCFSYGS